MHERRVSMSIFRPRMVFETVIALAPAFSAASATAVISPAFGESFAHSGLSLIARQAFTTLKVVSSLSAKLPPPGWRVGQEMLSSIASTPGTLTSRAICAKSSMLSEVMLHTSGGLKRLYSGSCTSRKYFRPLVGRPIELIMPASTSDTLGGGLPAREARDTALLTRAPRRFRSMTLAHPAENVPEAGMTGLARATPPVFTGQ